MIQEVKEMVRIPTSITLPKECIEWIDAKVERRVYANRSHAIEVLILDAMKREKEHV
jgi:Arc/MetJ-type ribon-helix-helix transcriptional regulator